jgi:hypothetical protein
MEFLLQHYLYRLLVRLLLDPDLNFRRDSPFEEVFGRLLCWLLTEMFIFFKAVYLLNINIKRRNYNLKIITIYKVFDIQIYLFTKKYMWLYKYNIIDEKPMIVDISSLSRVVFVSVVVQVDTWKLEEVEGRLDISMQCITIQWKVKCT